MRKTALKVKALEAVGVIAPARPVPPMPYVPADPTPEEIELDRIYQEACLQWIAEVDALYRAHLPDGIDPSPDTSIL